MAVPPMASAAASSGRRAAALPMRSSSRPAPRGRNHRAGLLRAAYDSATQKRITAGNAKGAQPPRAGPDAADAQRGGALGRRAARPRGGDRPLRAEPGQAWPRAAQSFTRGLAYFASDLL